VSELENANLPKVLLLGDSIRMSYQPIVSELLFDMATVVGPTDNCRYSLYTLSSLDRWMTDLGSPDVVHWNNGLHDSGYDPKRSPVQMSLAMYCANLAFILDQLIAMTPRVIWASSTPVHPDRPFLNNEWSWRNEEIAEYNAAARELFEKRGVLINDLHQLVWNDLSTLGDDHLHLSEHGQRVCAGAVAAAVSATLPE
jgi:hypothetical protein